MRMNRSSRMYPAESYDVEVWTKGILRVSGKRRVDMTVRVVKDGVEDREFEIYKTLVEDIKTYLSEKYLTKSKFQPIPDCINIGNGAGAVQENGKEIGDFESRIFMIENKGHMGFKRDLMENHEGLDYEHSVLVIAALGRFHATSHCFIKDSKVTIDEKYPVLKERLPFPNVSKETIQKLSKLFKTYPEYGKYSHLFLGPRNEKIKNLNLECFGVLSHGHFCRENLLFKYKSNLESTFSCCDVIFKDLSRCHYGSCVLDLLQFIFTSIDLEVRHNFMADFVCSVYYDSFAKTASSINSKMTIFSKENFIKEFDNKIMYGFLFSAEIHTFLHEEAKDNSVDEVSAAQIDEKYEKYILALMRDVLQFMESAKATII